MLAAVSIGVLTLFAPRSLLLTTASIEIGGEQVLAAQAVEVTAEGDRVRARLGSREWRGAALTSPGPAIRIQLPGRITRSWPGTLRVVARGGVLLPVVRMELESAVARVVAAEMPEGPQEATRAQAIAARSYYLAPGRRHAAFDFCDTTHCQLLQERESKAGHDTTGRVLRLGDAILRGLYFRSCGGTTRASVACPVCARAPVTWVRRLPRDRVPPPGDETARIRIGREFGWAALPSSDYTIEPAGREAILHGKGEGHGMGLCQRGAAGLASEGWDAAAILRHYFPGIRIGI